MNKKQFSTVAIIVALTVVLGGVILLMDKPKPVEDPHGHGDEVHSDHGKKDAHTDHRGDKHADAHDGHGHKDAHVDENVVKGPHGGQLFTEGDFGLEVLLAEAGSQPRLRVYLSNKGKPAAPNSAKVSVKLNRPDGSKQEIAFVPENDTLISADPIADPHVFEAIIAAQTPTEPFLFTYVQTEGKIALIDAQLAASGVTVQTVGAARIESGLQMPGEIRFNQDRTAQLKPSLTGTVEGVPVNLGQQVKKGQVLAVITSAGVSDLRSEYLAAQRRLELARTTHVREKQLWEEKISARQDYLQAQAALHEAEIMAQNARQKLAALGASPTGALNRYEIHAPFAGTIVEKHASVGELVRDDASIFTITDLSTAWAEVAVPAKDLNRVRVGTRANVKATAFDSTATGTVSYVGSLLGEQTRSAIARIVLPNPQMAWRPGLLVNVELVSDTADVPVAVTADAIHAVDGKPVVFLRVPGGFIAQPVTTGRSDSKWVEIVKGLRPGAQYAAAGGSVIKSELGKASAEHTH